MCFEQETFLQNKIKFDVREFSHYDVVTLCTSEIITKTLQPSIAVVIKFLKSIGWLYEMEIPAKL